MFYLFLCFTSDCKITHARWRKTEKHKEENKISILPAPTYTSLSPASFSRLLPTRPRAARSECSRKASVPLSPTVLLILLHARSSSTPRWKLRKGPWVSRSLQSYGHFKLHTWSSSSGIILNTFNLFLIQSHPRQDTFKGLQNISPWLVIKALRLPVYLWTGTWVSGVVLGGPPHPSTPDDGWDGRGCGVSPGLPTLALPGYAPLGTPLHVCLPLAPLCAALSQLDAGVIFPPQPPILQRAARGTEVSLSPCAHATDLYQKPTVLNRTIAEMLQVREIGLRDGWVLPSRGNSDDFSYNSRIRHTEDE